jgi:hypothetical protein
MWEKSGADAEYGSTPMGIQYKAERTGLNIRRSHHRQADKEISMVDTKDTR